MNDPEFRDVHPRLAAHLADVERQAKPRAEFTIEAPTGERQSLPRYVAEGAFGVAMFVAFGVVLAVGIANWGWSPWWWLAASAAFGIALAGLADTVHVALICRDTRQFLREHGVIR